MRVNTGAGYPASVITAISIGGESMASVLKTIASSVVAASVAVSAFSVSYAATLLEPVKINPVTISGLNTTFETDTHVDLQGIDAISIIPYTKSGNFPYVIQYDMTINTPLFAGSTDKKYRNAFGIGLAESDKSAEGGYFQVSAATDTTTTIIWKTSGTSTLGTLNNGTKYRISYTVSSEGVQFKAVDLSTNTETINVSGLGLRNSTYNNASVITVSQNARVEGQTDSVTIENAVMYDMGPDEINLSLDGKQLNDKADNVIAFNPIVDTYDLNAELLMNGAVNDSYTGGVSLAEKDDPSVALQSDIFSIEDNKLKIDATKVEANTDYSFNINAYETSSPESYVSFPVTLQVGDLSQDTVIKNAKNDIAIVNAKTGEQITANEDGKYYVDSDLTLTKGSSLIPITWECLTSDDGEKWIHSDMINEDGVFMPLQYDGQVKLVASFSYKGTDADEAKDVTVEFPIDIVDIEETYFNPAFSTIIATSVDDSTVSMPVSQITDLDYDITLPTSVEVADGEVAINWTSSSDNVKIEDNKTATIHTADFDAHDVTLTAEFVYKKNGTELHSVDHDYNVKVEFTEEDKNTDNAALDKYKVRFDSEDQELFEDIPTTASANIDLPTEGKFGSTIKWTSNAPTIISNTGTYKKPSANRTVTLTAQIMSGAVSDMKVFEVSVKGNSSSGGSSGGGGGGSSSSTGSSSSVSSGGTIANGSSTATAVSPVGQEKVDQLIDEKEQAENRFADLSTVSWARDAINGLSDAGIVNGKTDTLFAPNDTVTRAEFAKMLMGVFGLNSGAFTTSSFADVPTDAWYFQSVESAYNLGIINGVADGYFDPNANITRQDMAVMVMRAATVSGTAVTATEDATTFRDEAQISDYAKDAVTTLQMAGIINGVTDYEFAPLENATRAQAAVILYSFL